MTTSVVDEAPVYAKTGFVSIDHADLTYGDDGDGTLALRDMNLKIAQGQFAAVVGPSGCGKSTLLKLISGLRAPTAGGIIVADKEVAGPLKIVGMAFQNPTLLPWRTSLDNVLLPLQIVQPHRRRFRSARREYAERAQALFAKVGLRDVDKRYPWQLSGGMQQRVSLCRALIHDPALLLLDEPFGALDSFTRQELWRVLQALWLDKQFTVVLVTHDLEEAVFLADVVHVVSSRPGRIIHSRSIPLPRPRQRDDRYTARFGELVRELHDYVATTTETP